MSDEGLRLYLMGGAQITLNGDDITTHLPAKSQALVAYLVMNGHTFPRHQLSGLLWSDSNTNNALRSLRVALNGIKKVGLGDYLHISRPTLAFNQSHPYWLDVHAFEALIARNRSMNDGVDTAVLSQAVDLYRGDFLDTLDLDEGTLFEEWATSQRARLRQSALEAMDTLISQYMAEENYQPGIEYANRLLELDPWRESAHRQLMWLLARSGQRSAAIAQYEVCREVLLNELGLEPDSETVALYEDIRNTRPTASKPLQPLPPVAVDDEDAPPFQAPPAAPYFVGREQQMTRLKSAMTAASGQKSYCIAGMGGVGKTTLAACLAHRLRDSFPDGVLWATAVSNDPMEIAESWAQAYGYDFTGLGTLEERTTALRQMLSEKEALIVLDDVTVVSAVRPLLPTAGKCAILITSRDAEVAYALDFRLIRLDELSPENGRSLLTKYIGAERAGEDETAVAQICAQLQNLPLAVAIAGSYLRLHPRRHLDDFVSQLQFEANRLDLNQGDQQVRASFAISWQSLDDTQRRLFSQLAAFNGRDFSVAALAAVAEMPSFPAQDRLDSLVRLSLLSEYANNRYRQHILLADFARDSLGDNAEPFRRMAQYYLAYASKHQKDFAALRPEWDNLSAGVRTAHTQRMWRTVIDYTKVLREPWFRRGRYSEARRSFKWASEAAMNLEDEKTLADNWLYWGQACIEQSDSLEAESLIEDSLALYQELENLAGISDSLCDLARISLERSDYDKAETLLEESYDLRQRLRDDRGMAQVMYRQASIAYLKTNYNHGRQLLYNALAIYKRIDDTTGLIRTLRLSAAYMSAAAEDEAANKLYKRAFELAETIQDQAEMAVALRGLATTNRYLGQLELAQEYAHKSLKLLDRMGDRNNKARVLRELGRINFAAQAYEAALDFGLQSLELCHELQGELLTAYVQLDVGRAYDALGHLEKACVVWTDALTRAEQTHNERLKKDILEELRKCGD